MIQKLGSVNYESGRSVQAGQSRSLSPKQLAFGQVLSQQLQESGNTLRFSKHATERAVQRGMEMTPEITGRLEQAVETARGKGAREVAVIGPEGVFIVNIKNSVVVTSISNQELKDNVITNIDSAVIM